MNSAEAPERQQDRIDVVVLVDRTRHVSSALALASPQRPAASRECRSVATDLNALESRIRMLGSGLAKEGCGETARVPLPVDPARDLQCHQVRESGA